jgi:PAS domain S-box-containing protein
MAMNTPIDLNALVGAIGDAIVVCDAQGHVIFWNAAATRMFGYSQEEALGQSLDMIVPERLRKRHGEGYEHSMATGTTRYGNDVLRVPAVDKQGRAMSIAFTVAMLHGADGQVNAIAAVIRDETTRFQDDRALRQRVAALQAQVDALGAGQHGVRDGGP